MRNFLQLARISTSKHSICFIILCVVTVYFFEVPFLRHILNYSVFHSNKLSRFEVNHMFPIIYYCTYTRVNIQIYIHICKNIARMEVLNVVFSKQSYICSVHTLFYRNNLIYIFTGNFLVFQKSDVERLPDVHTRMYRKFKPTLYAVGKTHHNP
jgi:hypothetical protein